MMKAGRSIRKNECSKAILTASAAAMLVVCIVPALASATFIPPDPTNLANTTGDFQVNYTWQAGSGWYFIAGADDYAFNGLYWNGLAWQGDYGITSGIGNIGMNSAPTVFLKDGIWHLVSGEVNGSFRGYNWTGSEWQSDCEIVSGLGNIGMNSAPTVFLKDGMWYLVSGEIAGSFHGYNWTGSTWQSDSGITSGIPDVVGASTPTVFDMGNVTDSYNVSVNGVWNNGTTNMSVNGIGGSGGWANITVWAWNASGTGTLSAGCVSDNMQASATDGVNDTFGFVGSAPTGEGTYPPGWFETPTPTVAVTAAKTPAESGANASVTVTSTPPGERVTPTPAAAKRSAVTPAHATAARETATEPPVGQGLPGFTAVFATAGCLLAVYVVVRRRR
jgi:hypothetical protein